MNLSRALDRIIVFEGKRYRLNLSFDTVLLVMEIQRDKLLTPLQRLQLGVELIAGKKAAQLPVDKLEKLMTRINAEYVSEGVKTTEPGAPRVLDFEQDAALIYAAFRQAYGIDLNKERGQLDWRFFIALFQGLPDNTQIRQVMSIRQRPLPVANEHNAEQITALLKAKEACALQIDEDEAEATFQAGINNFAARLIARAGGQNVRR